jgi:hypothetical protein
MAGDVQLYPAWREAERKFQAAGFQYGETVTTAWFYQALGIEEPRPDMRHAEGRALQLQYFTQMEKLKDSLLHSHMICLATEPRVGFRVVPPGEQTAFAYERGVADIRKAFRKMQARVTNTNHAALTAAEKRENVDTMARLAALRAMFNRERRLPAAATAVGQPG